MAINVIVEEEDFSLCWVFDVLEKQEGKEPVLINRTFYYDQQEAFKVFEAFKTSESSGYIRHLSEYYEAEKFGYKVARIIKLYSK